MKTKLIFAVTLLFLLASIMAGCHSRPEFTAPEIDPPDDLIPGYLPEGFDLFSGYQLSSDFAMGEFAVTENSGVVNRLKFGDYFATKKSPAGNVIQGVYYQGKGNFINISKSYYPGGTLDDWLAKYEKAETELGVCDCAGIIQIGALPFPLRFEQFKEQRSIEDTPVAILEGVQGWSTFFVRGDYLLTVESGISLDENLKIVASLIND